MSVVERLRILLAEKFNQKPEEIELDLHPGPTKEWIMIVDPHPYIFRVFITAYKNGKIEIDTGPERTRSEISNFYLWEKYKQKYEKAMTEEEKKEIKQKEDEEENRILEDFKQKKFEDYLKAKGAISYFAKRHMWGDEIAKRMSSKHGLEVRFEIDFESGFATSFDSTGMNDEQLIDEIMRRIDVIAEAREMFLSEELMNDFLKTGE
jgi:hypothetical protein